MFNIETAIDRANSRRCGGCNTLDTVVYIKLREHHPAHIYLCLACAGMALTKLVVKEGDKKLDELL